MLEQGDVCPFCGKVEAVIERELVFARWDRYPVTRGHMLLIPRRHVTSYFDCTEAEKAALWALAEEAVRWLATAHSPDGYNVGFNVGAAAGQTVDHAHIHLIPRYRGEGPVYRGGVRGVIPDKQSY